MFESLLKYKTAGRGLPRIKAEILLVRLDLVLRAREDKRMRRI